MTSGDPERDLRPDAVQSAPRPDQLAATLVQMAGLVLSTETVPSAVELVTALATATAPSTDAAVTVLDEHGARTMAATSGLAEKADALQYQLDEGPCLTAARTGRVVRVDDAARDRRWPTWTDKATELGIRSALTAPLLVDGQPIGAMKLYALHPARFDDHDEQVMVLFARQAAILLFATQNLINARALSRRLTDALTDRDLIRRATGVLLAGGVRDSDAAFAELATAAERSGQPLREVARELLTTAGTHAADSPHAGASHGSPL